MIDKMPNLFQTLASNGSAAGQRGGPFAGGAPASQAPAKGADQVNLSPRGQAMGQLMQALGDPAGLRGAHSADGLMGGDNREAFDGILSQLQADNPDAGADALAAEANWLREQFVQARFLDAPPSGDGPALDDGFIDTLADSDGAGDHAALLDAARTYFAD